MKVFTHYIFRTITAVTLLTAGCALAGAQDTNTRDPKFTGKKLITEESQFLNIDIDPNLGNLIDFKTDTKWSASASTGTDNTNNTPVGHYIDVKINEDDRSFSDDESIVIYMRRTAIDNSIQAEREKKIVYDQPVTMRILGSDDNVTWTVFARAYFLYRGPETDEYSCLIHPEGITQLPKYMRFVVTANNTRTLCAHDGHTNVRAVKMSEFNIIKQNNTDSYTTLLKDRFRLTTDYLTYYKDNNYKFEHTLGILDAEHNQNGNAKEEYNKYISNWKDGKWTANPEFWGNKTDGNESGENQYDSQSGHFKMPEMNYITKETDQYNIVKEGVRQPTHITEHELYAVPGDMIALYPFYSMATTTYYSEKFSRWYDYETDEDNPYLDFLINPERIMPLNGQGYMAGENVPAKLSETTSSENGKETLQIGSSADFANFVLRVANGETELNAKLLNDVSLTRAQQELLRIQKEKPESEIITVPMIGSPEEPYRGTFDGGGYTINWYNNGNTSEHSVSINSDYVGLFRAVAPGATIKNIRIGWAITYHGRNFVGLIGGVVNPKDKDGTALYTGAVTLKEVVTQASVEAHGAMAGGLIGYVFDDVEVHIEDCGVTERVKSYDNFENYPTGIARPQGTGAYMFCGNLGNNQESYLRRCYAEFNQEKSLEDLSSDGYGLYRAGESVNTEKIYYRFNNQTIKDKYQALSQGEEWENFEDGTIQAKFGDDTNWRRGDGMLISYHKDSKIFSEDDRYYGTVGTFFMPRNPYAAEGHQQTFSDITKEKDRTEFIIAADFAYRFNKDEYDNISDYDKKIYEPTINFRHIFRIKDGKKFADDNMATIEKNRAFVRKNRRYVTARANDKFQLRFDSPVPAEGTTRSKWYYKASESDYRRICTMDLEVYDGDTNVLLERLAADNDTTSVEKRERRFFADEKFNGQGTRKIDGITYYSCGGGGSYYRMLKCRDKYAIAGQRYIVRLIAKDINGNPIKIKDKDGVEDELWVQEYYITFLDDTKASMLSEEELENSKYYNQRPTSLTETYGEPIDKIDYDEIRTLFNDPKTRDTYFINYDNQGHFFKWPMDWSSVTYAFGFNNHHDYNEYLVSNSSKATSYHIFFNDKPSLYDRRFYDYGGKDESEKGFFYYVNAAADPGNMAYLKLDEFCSGTTLFVSAWVAEFTAKNLTTANIAFNFQALLKKTDTKTGKELGIERIPIHTFVSGSVPSEKVGKWNHIYYSFEPDITRLGLYDGEKTEGDIKYTLVDYEIVLENNAKDSTGADYAIDDIRVYRSRPAVYANQIKPICRETDESAGVSAPIRVTMPFNMLMLSIGKDESLTDPGEKQDLYFTIIDKDKFDAVYYNSINWENNTINKEEINNDLFKLAYEASVVKFNYRGGENQQQTFAKLQFSTHFKSNPDYETVGKDDFSSNILYSDEDGGYPLLTFNVQPSGSDVKLGSNFYVVVYTPLENDVVPEGGPDHTHFRFLDDCSKYGEFTITSSNRIIIDGSTVHDGDQIVACANQSPVVQIKLLVPDKTTGGYKPIDGFTQFDWYLGTMHELNSEKMSDGTLLRAVLDIYRSEYPTLNNLSLAKSKGGDLTDDMIKYLIDLTTPSDDNQNAKLRLGGHSYAFSNLKPTDNKDEVRVVAIPLEYELSDDLKSIVCTAPTEVCIKIDNKAPTMMHGFANIEYPLSLNDVPLRIGLSQIMRTYGEIPTDEADDNIGNRLVLPVRNVTPASDESVTQMRIIGDDPLIYLAETDDPEYKDIRGNNADIEKLLEVGFLYNMKADKNDLSRSQIAAGFFKDFKFKEGYEYRLRYNFEEKTEEETNICDGQDIFTIKIVPEYQKWTGEFNDDWNNDLNWQRTDSGRLLLTDKSDKYQFTTDGTENQYATEPWNDNKRSYVPMDFTKTLIPKPESKTENKDSEGNVVSSTVENTGNVPYMANIASTQVTLNYDDNSALKDRNFEWSDTPGENATPDIQWDMASLDGSEISKDGKVSQNVYCRPWLANECEQIHFDAGSWIGGQQWLRYDKAWVDFEVSPTRWYTLSSPLSKTYAGDMYMPKDGARQLTEKFKDINYDANKNNRFKPAVFQRSWNTASVDIYELDGGNTTTKTEETVAETQWSKVYNDVQVAYGAGAGFSIMTDVSGMDNGIEVEKALIRLPKADTEYQYFQSDNFGGSSGNQQTVDKKYNHKLNGNGDDATVTVKVAAAKDGKYFLVGNPYMNYLDMAKFLEENKAEIKSSYWILTDEEQGAAVYLPSEGTFAGTITDADILAPMQGFFVESNDAGKELTLTFNAKMMADKSKITSDTELGTRASDTEVTGLRISVEGNDGEAGSSALLAVKAGTSAEYDPAEDARMLVDPTFMNAPQVYTVAGNVAATVNMTPDAAGTRIGLTNADDMTVTLRFDNVDAIDEMMLYDAQLDSYTPLEEGMEYEVDGEKRGRLFLVKSKLASTEGDISISADGGEVTVVSPTAGGNLTVNVYDTDGRMLRRISDGGQTVRFPAGKGIVIVEANDGSVSKTAKLILI